MKDWTEICVRIPCSCTDTAADICQMTVPYGIYIEDYSDLRTEAPKIAHIDLIDEELLQKDTTHALIHIYISPEENPQEAIAFLQERFSAEEIPFAMETKHVVEEEWATAWKKYYHPTPLSPRLVVCPTWEEYTPKQGEKVLSLDPGMAFGTGTHDTTRLCVQLLDRYVTQGMELLDVGCGSGILAIAGRILGCRSCVGVDIDQVAVKVAEENARLNQLTDVTFHCGDLVEKVTGCYDMVCANIVADVILRLAPQIIPFLKPEGIWIVSGIIEERAGEVATGLEQQGLCCIQRESHGGWVAMAYARGQHHA